MNKPWPSSEPAPRWFVAALLIILGAIVGGFDNVPAVWP